MELITELIKILAPAGLMLYLSYLLVRSFLSKQIEESRLKVIQKNQEVVLPIRLQAYERICLLLERVSPNNLITRLNNGQYSAKEFQQILVSEVRDELNHNLSQQVYMSQDAWTYVQGAVEDIITMINEAGKGMTPENSSLDLAKQIFDYMMENEKDMVKNALVFVKEEVRLLF